jgi:Ribosomal protein L24e
VCLKQQFLFLNQKSKSLFHQRKRPAKIAWTTTYRKQHKKVRRMISEHFTEGNSNRTYICGWQLKTDR